VYARARGSPMEAPAVGFRNNTTLNTKNRDTGYLLLDVRLYIVKELEIL